MPETLWGERAPGQYVVEVSDGDETALLFGDFDRARLPPELGGGERKVQRRAQARCPHPTHDHVVRALDLGDYEGGRIVVFECLTAGWTFCRTSPAWWNENTVEGEPAVHPASWRMP